MNDLGITYIVSVNAATWGIGSVLVDVRAVVLVETETLLWVCCDEIIVPMSERIRHYLCSVLGEPTERNRDIITTSAVYLLVYLEKLSWRYVCLGPWRYSEYGVRWNRWLIVVVK